MAVKLRRCSATWLKLPVHPCWVVQKALQEEGIDHESSRARYGVEGARSSSNSPGSGDTR